MCVCVCAFLTTARDISLCSECLRVMNDFQPHKTVDGEPSHFDSCCFREKEREKKEKRTTHVAEANTMLISFFAGFASKSLRQTQQRQHQRQQRQQQQKKLRTKKISIKAPARNQCKLPLGSSGKRCARPAVMLKFYPCPAATAVPLSL